MVIRSFTHIFTKIVLGTFLMLKSLIFSLLCLVPSFAFAETQESSIKEFLTDDVVAVAYVDLTQIDLPGMVEWSKSLEIEIPDLDRIQKVALQVQNLLQKFENEGAQHILLFLRVSDIQHQATTWVLPVDRSGNPTVVKNLLLSGRPDQSQVEHDMRPEFLPVNWKIVDTNVISTPDGVPMDSVKASDGTQKEQFSRAWEVLGDGDFGFLIFGDKDSRRVIRDVFPKLPEPFGEVDGALIAERLQWGGISVQLPPEGKGEITIQTTDETTAVTVKNALSTGLEFVSRLPISDVLQQDAKEAWLSGLSPQVEGTRVRISLQDLTQDISRISKILGPPVAASRLAAQRVMRVNQFKQIALAMHIYAGKFKALPAAANHDENGKPLLSWRVHLLPYLEEGDLYAEFHLDEPWDSEHNRKLITRMPTVYSDPDRTLRQTNSLGRTTFVVPVHAETVFHGTQGSRFKDITDGTSNTVMLVEVIPERAVTWTQPEDWEVDLNKPLRGVKRSDRETFAAAFADGSVRVLSNDVSKKAFKGLLTLAGEEVVER